MKWPKSESKQIKRAQMVFCRWNYPDVPDGLITNKSIMVIVWSKSGLWLFNVSLTVWCFVRNDEINKLQQLSTLNAYSCVGIVYIYIRKFVQQTTIMWHMIFNFNIFSISWYHRIPRKCMGKKCTKTGMVSCRWTCRHWLHRELVTWTWIYVIWHSLKKCHFLISFDFPNGSDATLMHMGEWFTITPNITTAIQT